VDHYARAYPIFSRIRGYRRFEDMLYSLRRFSRDEIAQERFKIIQFYDRFREQATKEAFGADRKVIHVWKKRLKEKDNKLMALIPYSTKPKRVRKMNTDLRIIEFIKEKRKQYPKIGKEKLKPLLDKYCSEHGIQSISESTIGKIIKRNKFFFQKAGRIYHDPNSKFAQNAQKRKKRLRLKHPPRHTEYGHFQADSSFVFLDGLKRYIISAIDSKLKFAFSSCYSHLSSRNGRDFFKRLELVYPLHIKSVQTDNGAEFLGDFDKHMKKRKIPHYFSYPHCPKINGCVERFNRTLKEEFVYNNLDVIDDMETFRRRLSEYLIFYNTERPHKTIGLKSPIDYLISEGAMSKKIATYQQFRNLKINPYRYCL
jgi:transposase InsO family protein